MHHFRPFGERDRTWPMAQLRAYSGFIEFEPAWTYDPKGPDVAASRRVLKFTTIRQMALEADRMCRAYTGARPPSPVALFLYQFPDRDYEDCVHAHWALHADKISGPGNCGAAAWIEPIEYPDDGAEIQKWAIYHLTRHPWDGPARGMAEKMHRSAKVRWFSDEARAMLADYITENHKHAGRFFGQAPLHTHPLA